METKDHASTNSKKVYRSKANRVIGGVCGGIAEYFNIDPLIVRIGWVFISLFAGAGIIAYIAALIIMPDNPNQSSNSSNKPKTSGDGAKLWGSVLIIIGGILLLKQTGVLSHFYFWSFPWQAFLALLLIGFGIYIIFYRKTNIEESNGSQQNIGEKTTNYYRINEGKMIAGVCTGLSSYFDVDVTLIRLLWVFGTLTSGGLGILAYIIAVIIFPDIAATKVNSTGGEK